MNLHKPDLHGVNRGHPERTPPDVAEGAAKKMQNRSDLALLSELLRVPGLTMRTLSANAEPMEGYGRRR